jgi:signal transduction histidine kinase
MLGGMQDEDIAGIELAALASHLHARRSDILAAWSRLARLDPEITTSQTLSRVQFYDHIPGMLDSLERRLRATRIGDALEAQRDEASEAEGHGLQRWQQGYADREVMHEWVALNACLADELQRFAESRPKIAPVILCEAWRRVSEFAVTGMSESVAQYAGLQRTEAASRVAALESALAQLAELERQRAEAWREAAHDLRGNLSVVENVANVIQAQGPSEKWLRVLGRGVTSLSALLNDLTTQARLDAGHETRELAPFDAGAALGELCAALEPLAAGRSLFLRSRGPASLTVEGDRVKVCRIAQNLILNALANTERGGVEVSWEEVDAATRRWSLCVKDTGPGLDAGRSVPPLSEALDVATRESQAVEREGVRRGDPSANPAPAPTLPSRSHPGAPAAGDGIGLSIVKRLCELLDASIELETREGSGTTFRITFPTHYPKG